MIWKIKTKIPFVILIAFSVCILLYSGFFTWRYKKPFSCLIRLSDIDYLQGSVAGNPKKTASGNYSVLFTVTKATHNIPSGHMSSSAVGQVRILVDADIVEAYYPGKLYSKTQKIAKQQQNYSKKDFKVPIVEEGALLEIWGEYKNFNSLETQSKSVSDFIKHANDVPLFFTHALLQMGWQSRLAQWRWYLRLAFKSVLYQWGDAGGLLLALLSGSSEYTNEKVSYNFRQAGLAHVLALSGMHLAIFSGFATLFGFLGGKTAFARRFGVFLQLILSLTFVWFAGLSPSLVRAILSMIIGFVALWCYCKNQALSVLACAFIIQVFVFPTHVYSPAFMLSYGAILGILIASSILQPVLQRFLPQFLALPLTASLGAQIFTAPISIMLFGAIMPIGIISSIIIGPLVLVYLVCGIIFLCLCAIMPFLLYPLSGIINAFYTVIVYCVQVFALAPAIIFKDI